MATDLPPLTTRVDVPAALIVRPAYGDERPATPEDLACLGYIDRALVYRDARRALAKVATGDYDADLTASPTCEVANLVRYVIECAVYYSESPEKIVDALLNTVRQDGHHDDFTRLREALTA